MAAPTEVVLMPDEPLYEVVAGQRVELPPRSAYESDLASALVEFLRSWGRQNNVGRALGEALFEWPGLDRQRRPDVAFVSYQRWPRRRRVPRDNAWAVVPELAVEVVSPSNLFEDVLDKVAEYFRAGVSLSWVVVPAQEQVYVYTSPTRTAS
jgi:Uma2 family endonuclease